MAKYCVIGQSLPHTLSPEIHRAFGNGNYGVTELKDADALRSFVSSNNYDGYNVTIPYKKEIMPLLDDVSEEASEIGAVNTVVSDRGKLIGYNTDVGGMRYALSKAGIALKNKTVMILGSGGTCRTASYLCRREGAKSVIVVSRKGEVNYENCYGCGDTQVIINTTPVGMMPHAYEKPIELNRFKKLEGVFDCIYNPLETMLIKEARSLGLKCANGLYMLVEQARLAHNLFFKDKVREATTDSVAANMIEARKNVVLIGMAGSGKSAIGKRVAKLLGREFVDTDEEIERLEGKTIPQIFEESGESCFRQIESRVVEDVCMRQGIVISTGGGAVLNNKNVFFMQCNGDTFLIKRDADKLDVKGRPLSKDIEAAKTLYEKRKPIYEASADFVIENDGSLEQAADKILSLI